MNKHTPGPWEETYNTSDNTWGVCLPEGGDVLAQLIENQTNATLLAAAPAMYEALVKTMKVLRSLRDSKEELYTLVTPELLTAWDMNKAALSQAEGRDK